jgi:acetyl-CoA synthetase
MQDDRPQAPMKFPSMANNISASEERVFRPSERFVENALVTDRTLYDEAATDFAAFWARQAREMLTWDRDFSTTVEWSVPSVTWFDGGTLNASYNCVDRHVTAGHGAKVAFYWEGEPGDVRTITYDELLTDVQRFANVLKQLGLTRGDRVAIYLPMIPELAIAMLACARIGVAHSVIFAGFSPDSIADRCSNAEARLVITADAGYRRGEPSPLKSNVDEALTKGVSTVDHVVVVNRCSTSVSMTDGRDHWWHDLMAAADAHCPPEPMESEQLLFLLYTSGTTAKPKGVMHTTGGFLTHVAFTHKYVFDLKPMTDVYWCSADAGWITGHSYVIYGPLANGCTSVMYEGTPDTPRAENRHGSKEQWPKDRMWEIIERYGVTQLYTAPTAIRTFMKWGDHWPASRDLSTLRVLGTVGEPINPEAWLWYHEQIGGGECPIVDTWWQTETGGHMISPLPGVTSTKPGTATVPLPGIFVEVVDEDGTAVREGDGYLTVTRPWPGMLRGIWGDPARYFDTYWARFGDRYFTGDGARIDADGHIWILGRVDDVMNVSGHRISTAEVESVLVDHPAVAEAAVVGVADDLTGQAIVGYVVLRGETPDTTDLVQELRRHVAKRLGPTARPQRVQIVIDLPKTRSGKVMRRLLRDIAEDRPVGDVTALADPSVVRSIRDGKAT